MKITSALFFILLFSSFKDDLTPTEVKEKVDRIKAELLSGKELPASIVTYRNSNPKSLNRTYHYSTFREENNIIDSVGMLVEIWYYKDSLGSLSFDEVHFQNKRRVKSYMYQTNKEGIIDWAYRTEAPKGRGEKTKTDSSWTYMDPSPPIMEIHTDSTNVPPPIVIPDKQTIEKYNALLRTTLEELEKILFKK